MMLVIGATKGSEETPGHVVPAADKAEAGDKHARTEDTKPSGSPKKDSKKPKTDLGDLVKDHKAEKADSGAAKGVDIPGGDKPTSPTKDAAAVGKDAQPSSPVKAAPSSPKKAAASKKQTAEKVESADKKA